MAAQSIQKEGPSKSLHLTYSPSSDRALNSIASELGRIADALDARAHAKAEADATSAAAVEDGPAADVSPQDEALFQALREWRAGEARKLGMPSYIVATDKVLRAVVQAKPATVEDLRGIPGFGPAKTAKYGEGIVAVVAAAPLEAAA